LKSILRCIAALTLLGTAGSVLALVVRWAAVRTILMPPWGVKGTVLATSFVLILVGAFAAARLLALRDDGRVLLAGVLALLVLLSILSMVMRVVAPGRPVTVIRNCLEAMMVGILLSPAARRACAGR
jgi:hypothetical protein